MLSERALMYRAVSLARGCSKNPSPAKIATAAVPRDAEAFASRDARICENGAHQGPNQPAHDDMKKDIRHMQCRDPVHVTGEDPGYCVADQE